MCAKMPICFSMIESFITLTLIVKAAACLPLHPYLSNQLFQGYSLQEKSCVSLLLTIHGTLEEEKYFVAWILLRKGSVGILGSVPFAWAVPLKSREAMCVLCV